MSQLQKRNQTQPLPSLNIKMKLLTLHIKTQLQKLDLILLNQMPK
ncbi:Uncharacterised protein [Mycobacterium tuberculosis]|nr:Uncharacterised protein [Mycobacterium tuberculosis]